MAGNVQEYPDLRLYAFYVTNSFEQGVGWNGLHTRMI